MIINLGIYNEFCVKRFRVNHRKSFRRLIGQEVAISLYDSG